MRCRHWRERVSSVCVAFAGALRAGGARRSACAGDCGLSFDSSVLETVRMDKLAKKKARAGKRTYFSESRPTLTDIQHLFPSKSEAVLAKEAGSSATKGPVVTRTWVLRAQWLGVGSRGGPTECSQGFPPASWG